MLSIPQLKWGIANVFIGLHIWVQRPMCRRKWKSCWRLLRRHLLRGSSRAIYLSIYYPLTCSIRRRYINSFRLFQLLLFMSHTYRLIAFCILLGSVRHSKPQRCHCFILLPSQVAQNSQLYRRFRRFCSVFYGWWRYIKLCTCYMLISDHIYWF